MAMFYAVSSTNVATLHYSRILCSVLTRKAKTVESKKKQLTQLPSTLIDGTMQRIAGIVAQPRVKA
jgi:hypothetical protein